MLYMQSVYTVCFYDCRFSNTLSLGEQYVHKLLLFIHTEAENGSCPSARHHYLELLSKNKLVSGARPPDLHKLSNSESTEATRLIKKQATSIFRGAQ